MDISLVYGARQQFRFRHRDINVIGHVDAALPLRRSAYRLNDGPPVAFFVKAPPDDAGKARKGASINRLVHDGDFNIEIPVTSEDLKPGDNTLVMEIEDGEGERGDLEMRFSWNPHPVTLPLDLADLSAFVDIQELGQVVDGAFDIYPDRNEIQSRAPVGSDILLLLGFPHGSQEATYDIRFSGVDEGIFLGLSDFFAGHEADDPDVGIKPGWSSAGLATLRPNGLAQTWLAFGDLTRRKEFWVVKTDPGNPFPVQADVRYSVRHQVIFRDGADRVRFRIWPADGPEPDTWLCEESDLTVADSYPKFTQASFGLFQSFGSPTAWSNIRVREL